GLLQKRAELFNAVRCFQIEIDASMDAALAEVTVKGTDVAVFVVKSLQIAQIDADTSGRHGRIFPALPVFRLARNMRGRSEPGLAHFPDLLLFVFVVEELHGWRVW